MDRQDDETLEMQTIHFIDVLQQEEGVAFSYWVNLVWFVLIRVQPFKPLVQRRKPVKTSVYDKTRQTETNKQRLRQRQTNID